MNKPPEKHEKQSVRGFARRRAMIDAAWTLLLEKGFAGVTLNDVISRSGGSRTTVYEAFGGKDGLLAAAMTEQCMEFSSELYISLESDLPPRDALMKFGKTLSKKLATEDAARFTQILFSEGQHFIPLVEKFFEHGPGSTRKRLADYLSRQDRIGNLVIDDPAHMAEVFEAMIIGNWQSQIMKLDPPAKYDCEEIHQRVTRAVDIFLNGTATDNYRRKLSENHD